MLATDPGPGISAWVVDEANILNMEASIEGPEGSPFGEGSYRLSVQVPERYPLEPPRVRFVTPIYHPNIDSEGRICLDTLKMQPQGCWSPSININTVLLTIRVLMAQPNAEDGLVPDITEEYKRDINLWKKKALEHTRLNAIFSASTPAPSKASDEKSTSITAVSLSVPKRGRDNSSPQPISDAVVAESGVKSNGADKQNDKNEEVDDKYECDEGSGDDDENSDEDNDDEEVGVSLFADESESAKRQRVS